MGEALKQRQRDEEDDDDEELFDSGSLSSNSDDDGDQEEMNQNGSLCELSTLVEQLPIKRGLSNYYSGKSQSYTSLSVVRTLKDLPKKESPYKRKMKKTCKSYGGEVVNPSQPCGRGAMPRKAPRPASCASLAAQGGGGGGGGQKPPLVPLQKNSCNSH